MICLKTPAIRRFTATIAAAATALALMTAAAVPARAGQNGDDFAKAIAALAAIAIIGTAINSRDDDRAPPRHVYQPPRQKHIYSPPQRERRATVLPAQCAVQLRGHRQSEVVYPERCLRRAGVDRRLPQRCEVSLSGHRRGSERGRGHGRTAYEQNCLLNAGFREQGRRRY
jgi:hypothetical protein